MLSQPQGHMAAGIIKSMKNLNNLTGKGTRFFSGLYSSAQTTAPPRTLSYFNTKYILSVSKLANMKSWSYKRKCNHVI